MPVWLKRTALVVLFWSYVLFGLGWASGALHPPAVAPQPTQHEQSAEPQEPESFWTRLTTDPTGFFTGIVALFTLVLAGSTILLWRETRAAGELASRIHSDDERPWLSLGLNSVIQEFALSNFGDVSIDWWALNVGKSPAVDVRMHAQLMRISAGQPHEEFDRFLAISLKRSAVPMERSRTIFPTVEGGEAGHRVMEDVDTAPDVISQHYWLFLCLTYRASGDRGRTFHTAHAFHADLVPGDHAGGVTVNVGDEDRPFNLMGINSMA